MIAATAHDRFALKDYQIVAQYGMRTVRDGVRWHLVESTQSSFDFSSWIPMIHAAQKAGVQVIWDLLHFGWPEHVDVFSDEFPRRFGQFARECARVLRTETSGISFVAPANEISFLSWAGGERGFVFPHQTHRAGELKRQLVRAAIAGIDAVRSELTHVRFIHPEPVINIVGRLGDPQDQREARDYTMSQYEAWDMVTGRLCPELGGREDCLDIVGINYYDRNQWIHNDEPIPPGHPFYKPFHQIVKEVYTRYRRPLFIAETGAEDDYRAAWLRYVASQIRIAMTKGIPVHGICLYPIVNHPGWADDRHCCNGLLDYADEEGQRDVHEPLAKELEKQQEILMSVLEKPEIPSGCYDLVCLSHLRWQFVFQRPQHLMSRFARDRRVLFVEEPVSHSGPTALHARTCPQTGVQILVPHLNEAESKDDVNRLLEQMLKNYLSEHQVVKYVAWYYTPMALGFTQTLSPVATVYDCMDELSAFRGAPPELRENEAKLLQKADLVFTGGMSLFEAKAGKHKRLYPFPSGVDVNHFRQARIAQSEPADQAGIPHPRLGFAGVVDERFDIDLLRGAAELRPDWHFVIVGPVVKIDQTILPQGPNIYYLGAKDYRDLPAYMSGWDVAVLLFARNESTRYISPTKTPEYLAAGRPTVSTSITDIVRPYKELGLVQIADEPKEFVEACERALALPQQNPDWIKAADSFLLTKSWDSVWTSMENLIQEVLAEKVPVTSDATEFGSTNVISNNKGAQECSIS